jgi:MscS family membrane protein
MNPLLRRISLLVLCLSLSAPTWGQDSITQILDSPNNGKGKTGPATPTDPLGRQTPNGTLFGFLQAMQAGNYATAAQYLQLSPAKRSSQGEQLATELKTVLDGAFVGSLKAISTNPEGSVQPGLPADREKLGTFSVDDSEADVMLVRVTDPIAGKIWLFSADTLAKVPELSKLLQAHQVETHVPHALVKTQFLGMSVWLWLALLAAAPVAAGLAWVLIELVVLPLMLWRRYRKQPQLADWWKVSGPLWLVLGVMIHRILVSFLGMPLLHRHYYAITAAVVFIIGAGWLALRVLSRGMERLRDRAIARGSTGTGSLVLLAQRMLKVVVVLFAGLAVLGALGFNLTTALAGLGIGGLAIGFGAQKTIENLFGGISLLGDEVIRVGDSCNFNGRVGTVEDISLRSTRIRTVERTELSIPNGTLATMNVENLSRRDKFLFNPNLGLRPETTPDQLRYVLIEARRLLYQHPKVETTSARIRLATLDQGWPVLEVFSYVLTRDGAEFTAIREDLLFRLMALAEDAGTGFAFPSRAVYLGRAHGGDQAKEKEAEAKVRQWREQKQLPFPDFAPAEISEIRDTLPYPPPESAVSREKGVS